MRILIVSAALNAAIPFRSEPADAAVADVLGTLSVLVAEILILFTSIWKTVATT